MIHRLTHSPIHPHILRIRVICHPMTRLIPRSQRPRNALLPPHHHHRPPERRLFVSPPHSRELHRFLHSLPNRNTHLHLGNREGIPIPLKENLVGGNGICSHGRSLAHGDVGVFWRLLPQTVTRGCGGRRCIGVIRWTILRKNRGIQHGVQIGCGGRGSVGWRKRSSQRLLQHANTRRQRNRRDRGTRHLGRYIVRCLRHAWTGRHLVTLIGGVLVRVHTRWSMFKCSLDST